MDEKNDNVSGQSPMGYQGSQWQPPPAYPGQQPQVAGQQPGYPVQQQPGYPVQQQPGYPVQQQTVHTNQVVVTMPPAQKMNNNLVLAIIATICCCPLCGIIGIVYAAQVDSAFFRGDVGQAQNYADNARRWSIAAIVCGVIWVLIVIVYYIVAITSLSSY